MSLFIDSKQISNTMFYKYPSHWVGNSSFTNREPTSNYILFAKELDDAKIPWKLSIITTHLQIIPKNNFRVWSNPEINKIKELATKYGYSLTTELVTKNYQIKRVKEGRGFRLNQKETTS